MVQVVSAVRQFKFSVNVAGCNKNWDFKMLSAKFRDRPGNIYDVITHIKYGHAICGGLLNNKWRKKANVIGSYWILIDIDNSGKDENGEKIYFHQMTLDEALADPFIRSHCALIYTTSSHTPEWHKFRLVFLLPDYVEGAETVEVITRSLMKYLPHDPACKDASRVFYGSTTAEFPLVQPNATLPYQWVVEAISTAKKEKEEYEQRLAEITVRRQEFQEKAQAEGWDLDQLIRQALNCIPPRSIGSGNYNECRQVLMALAAHYGATEAIILGEQWSPSIKGTTWNVSAKVKSFRREGIGIGSLFHIAKQYGFKFPKKEFNRKDWVVKKHGLKDGNQEAIAFIQRIYAGVSTYRQWIAYEVEARSLGVELSESAPDLTDADRREFSRLQQACESAFALLERSQKYSQGKAIWEEMKKLPIDSEEYKQLYKQWQTVKKLGA